MSRAGSKIDVFNYCLSKSVVRKKLHILFGYLRLNLGKYWHSSEIQIGLSAKFRLVSGSNDIYVVVWEAFVQ